MRKIISLLLCFLLLSLCSKTAFAEDIVNENESNKGVVISLTVPNNHTITVIADGAKVSLDGVTGDEFIVERQSTPKLLIKADSGRVIKSVTLEENDVVNKLQDDYLQLEPVYKDLTLIVTTETAPYVPDIPQTKVNNNLEVWWIPLIISAFVLTVISITRRRIQNKAM